MGDSSTKEQNFILGLWCVRYQVKEVQRSIEFYTKILGFNRDQQSLPAFGQVYSGFEFRIIIDNRFLILYCSATIMKNLNFLLTM